MSLAFIRHGISTVSVAALGLGACYAADQTSTRPDSSRATISSPATRSPRPGQARGPLPDPSLLDGAAQQPEKKSEYGMLGEFELPGDENVRDGKVGGQQNPQAAGGAAGQPQQQQGGGGGAQGQQQGAQGQSGGAQAGGPQQAGGAQAGGGPAGTEQSGSAAQGSGNAAGGEPIGQAQGIQVAGLEGDAGGQAGTGGPGGTKPQQVAIGDSTMKIQTVANPTGVVGGQPAGQTQEHAKGTGSGGKGPAGGNNSNRGAERGRAMPSGL